MHPISTKIQQLIKSTPQMTQAILADNIGISRATITRWFKDPREPEPEYKTVMKICEFFELPPEYFYEELSPLYTGEFDNHKIVVEMGNPDDMGYFLDPETLKYAEELRNNHELKALFDVARDMPKEKLEAIYNLLKNM